MYCVSQLARYMSIRVHRRGSGLPGFPRFREVGFFCVCVRAYVVRVCVCVCVCLQAGQISSTPADETYCIGKEKKEPSPRLPPENLFFLSSAGRAATSTHSIDL